MSVYGGVGAREYAFTPDVSLVRRILDCVVQNDGGCWIWQRATSGSGYARISIDGKLYMAHRVLYTMLAGPIDPALDLDHLCRERLCINPRHLEPVTRLVNLHRGSPNWKKPSTGGVATGEEVAPPVENTA